MPRAQLVEKPPNGVAFLPTGSINLNLVLGGRPEGGWAQGRIVNIVGDRSSGKTLLAIEACANFASLYDPKRIRYAEAEAAFDEVVKLGRDILTVEDFYTDLAEFLEEMKGGHEPCLYVLDSLDALSDEAEMKSGFDDPTYGTAKARKMSQLFRRITNAVESSNCTLIIISQVRAKIGVAFGEKTTRSGGKALDFYASQILWLSELGKVTRTLHGEKRVVGLEVRARARKNKVAPPYRETELTILFNYGVDDEQSMLLWLKEHKSFGQIIEWSEAETKRRLAEARERQDREALKMINAKLRDAVSAEWLEIEQELKPTIAKYA
jgi:recombination protein RecA